MKRRLFKYSILSLIVLLCFESCAVHKLFPFICFKRSCIDKQWHFRDMKASAKKMNATMSARRKKRNAKDSSSSTKSTFSKSGSSNDNEPSGTTKNDSLVSVPKGIALSDTMIVVHYLLKEDSLQANDKLFLEHYFKQHPDKTHININLQEYTSNSGVTSYSARIKYLIAYLQELSVSVSLISVHTPKPPDHSPGGGDKIEIRIK